MSDDTRSSRSRKAILISRRSKAIMEQLRLVLEGEDLDREVGPAAALEEPELIELTDKYETREAALELSLAERKLKTLSLVLSEERGSGPSGLTGYRYTGYATNRDRDREFLPNRARGINRDLGLFHQAYVDSAAYGKSLSKIVEGLTTSHWWVKPADVDSTNPILVRRAARQAVAVQKALFGLEGGWSKHIGEALYGMLVPGFAPFLRIYDERGRLRELSFRYPSTVSRWLTDDNQNRILGIEFSGVDSAGRYTRLSHELLLYQYRSVGNDFEGLSPMRAVYKYIQAHKLFSQLEGVAAEKYGAPLTTVERPAEGSDKADDDALLADLDDMLATDNPIILLPNGYKVTLSSPDGQMPDLEPAKRYCDEQVTMSLTAEGSLIGLNGKGAYNLADVKDDQQLRTLAYYAKLICDVINGLNTPHTGVIRDLVMGLDDSELDHPLAPDTWPTLCWSLAPDQDDGLLDRAISAFEKGILTKTEADEDWIRSQLKLPSLAHNRQAEAGAPAASPSADTDEVDAIVAGNLTE